ncbi:hypothetical protein BH23GEM6_BH23GEM6_26500 [soil metagenome]
MVAKNAVRTTWPAVFLSDTAMSAKVSKAVKRGELVKIGPRLYTSKVEEPQGTSLVGHHSLQDVVVG